MGSRWRYVRPLIKELSGSVADVRPRFPFLFPIDGLDAYIFREDAVPRFCKEPLSAEASLRAPVCHQFYTPYFCFPSAFRRGLCLLFSVLGGGLTVEVRSRWGPRRRARQNALFPKTCHSIPFQTWEWHSIPYSIPFQMYEWHPFLIILGS